MLVINPSKPVFDELIESLSEDSEVNVVRCANALECVGPVQMAMASVVVCYGFENNEIIQELMALKMIQREIKSGSARFALLTPSRQTSILSKFNFLGVTEVIPDPTPSRSLLFKIQRHVKAMSARLAQAEQSTAADGPIPNLEDASTTSSNSSRGGAKRARRARDPEIKPEFEVEFKAPLDVDGDFWLVSDQRVKRVGGKWIIKLKGPSSAVGDWVSVKGAEEAWAWQPHRSADPEFGALKGRWIFYGQKPDYEDDLWWFIGLSPQLSYEIEGSSAGLKIALDLDGKLQIAQDSRVGASFAPKIEQSIRKAGRSNMDPEAQSALAPEAEGHEGRVSSRGGGEESLGDAVEYDLIPPLDLPSDCWVLDENKVRRVNRLWMVKLAGPGPAVGRWIPAQNVPLVEGMDSWQFEITSDRGRKLVDGTDGGSWVFYGRQPKFEGDGWVFVSPQPLLGYFIESDTHGNKIAWNENDTLILALDSENAKSKMPLVRQSWQNLLKEAKTEGDDEFGKLKNAEGAAGREINDLRQDEALSKLGYAGTLSSESQSPELEAERGSMTVARGGGWSGQPAVSPLGLAFLVAELSVRSGAQSPQVAEKWMGYLSTACGGAVVELWLMHDDRLELWVSTDPDRDSVRVKWAKSHAGSFLRENSRGEAMVPVKSEDGKLLGAIVLSGEHVAQLTDAYLKALEWSIRGVLKVNAASA